MQYNFNEIEQKWQDYWKKEHSFHAENNSDKPPYYVLDMFPYPSGAGLHVGHPLGYIASDIIARYKRLKGFNVLHPMGFDSFGLPAEQYALSTGQHPADTTEKNIATYKRQLEMLGLSYDWQREVRTSDPKFYKWTQWIFLKLFGSWYNKKSNKAESIDTLVAIFEQSGTDGLLDDRDDSFTAAEWKAMTEKQKQDILMDFRLVYSSFGEVNWCEELGTVLANDEVVNGRSERGGYPVVKRKMRQWNLRITAYADRLLEGLEQVDFSEAMKEMQRNWIGRSEGAEVIFRGRHSSDSGEKDFEIKVYTTRPDTIFGVDFMVLAPEHELVQQITTSDQKEEVEKYLDYVKHRSDLERLAEVKQVTGCFTGAYVTNPFNGKQIPVWIGEYVLSGYGTGAIMAVPCGDERDFRFARHFDIPITNIIGDAFDGENANPTKDAILQNSDFLNGMRMRDAIGVIIDKIVEHNIGKRKVNYKMRDAGYSRQRYWGEPFPILWKDGIAYPMSEDELPLELPYVPSYKPGKDGEGPLSNLDDWVNVGDKKRETSTMPGYAGSSWYFLRYMDPHNDTEFADRKATDYWQQVDLYVGGTEHAVGHLLYSRMWTKFLYDLGYISFDEPYKELINQGMITGKSYFFRIEHDKIVSDGGQEEGDYVRLKYGHKAVDTNKKLTRKMFEKMVEDHILVNPQSEITWKNDGVEPYIFMREVSEKMSKSKFNVDNPDDLIREYGADTLRLYEMFLGPVEQSKPWNTQSIEGVHRFLKKLWKLFYDDEQWLVNDEKATPAELKVLHNTIEKMESDLKRFSLNTVVSAFMVCINELNSVNCHKRAVLEPLLILISPYAPHIAEELYHRLGHDTSISSAAFPIFEKKYTVETEKEYPVAINGKMRTKIHISLDASQKEVEKIVMENDTVQKWLDGKPPRKVIYVKNKMINIVI